MKVGDRVTLTSLKYTTERFGYESDMKKVGQIFTIYSQNWAGLPKYKNAVFDDQGYLYHKKDLKLIKSKNTRIMNDELYTIDQIRNYILSQDSREEALDNLSHDKIIKANLPAEDDFWIDEDNY